MHTLHNFTFAHFQFKNLLGSSNNKDFSHFGSSVNYQCLKFRLGKKYLCFLAVARTLLATNRTVNVITKPCVHASNHCCICYQSNQKRATKFLCLSSTEMTMTIIYTHCHSNQHIFIKYGQIVVLVLCVYDECGSNGTVVVISTTIKFIMILLVVIGCDHYCHLHHLPMQLNCCARAVLC